MTADAASQNCAYNVAGCCLWQQPLNLVLGTRGKGSHHGERGATESLGSLRDPRGSSEAKDWSAVEAKIWTEHMFAKALKPDYKNFKDVLTNRQMPQEK